MNVDNVLPTMSVNTLLIWTIETIVTSTITKSFGFKTLAPICLTLFLSFAAITTKESLSIRSCKFKSLTKCGCTVHVNIIVIQQSLWAEIKLIPGILGFQNTSFHRNCVHVIFIPINNYSKDISWVASTSVNHWNGHRDIISSLTRL